MGIMKYFTTALAALSTTVTAAQLEQVSNFGTNPSNVRMYIYVPDTLPANPAVIVAIHYCTGTAQAFYGGTQYARLADQHGYIVIYPESPYSGGCWDVSSDATLMRDGGGDSQGIASMVRYTLDQYSADASRVFVLGSSSGAMMTNVLAATYPDLFQAASVHSGVPAGCFYTGTVNGWNSQCSGGTLIHTQDEWAQIALDMNPGYDGNRPRIQIFHGDADTTLSGQNYEETVKQWTGVFGYDTEPDEVAPNDPSSPWTKEVYGENIVGYIGAGQGHSTPLFEQTDLEWFGIV